MEGLNGVGAASNDAGRLESADTLLRFVSACDSLLADKAWLSSQPDHRHEDVLALRNRLVSQLGEHAECHTLRKRGTSTTGL